jgi:CRP-like cAMP-binding protein
MSFPGRGIPSTGPVSALNLLNKKRATLKFLRVHHEDLQHAIELAGANEHNAQETWHRVFRDAERAVLRMTPAAFPELSFLPKSARDFVLWHQKGRWGLEGALGKVVPVLGAVFGDDDGLFPSACHEYRASMNHVAAWGKSRGLMDYTGPECVPEQVSLFEAYLAGGARLGPLQRRDGYAEQLDATPLPDEYERTAEDLATLIAGVPLFQMLTAEEQRGLATTGRCIAVGPMERILIEGREGSSLFIIVDGTMEVLVRQPNGVDLPVATMGRGAVIGEMSLLTGERRCATVRAVDGAVVYEIGRTQYEPLLRDRPGLVDDLARLMEERLRERQVRLDAYDVEAQRKAIGARIRGFFFGA